MPEFLPLESSGIRCWPEDFIEKFLEERLPVSKKILTAR
jgi:hypothetical protein